MELEQQLSVLSFGVLAPTSSVFGVKFVGKGNYLLGVVWLVVALSGASIVVYALGDVDAAYSVAYFCDAFLRGCGGPAIMILGLTAVTHGYRPLPYVDLYLFGMRSASDSSCVHGSLQRRHRQVSSAYLESIVRADRLRRLRQGRLAWAGGGRRSARADCLLVQAGQRPGLRPRKNRVPLLVAEFAGEDLAQEMRHGHTYALRKQSRRRE